MQKQKKTGLFYAVESSAYYIVRVCMCQAACRGIDIIKINQRIRAQHGSCNANA
jgi:hypothetical protein